MDKNIYKKVTYGMYVLTTSNDGKQAGCIINTFNQITSQDYLISVSVNKDNYTNQVIKESKRFAISIISEKTSPNVIATFGFTSSKNTDKFMNFAYEMIDNLPVIKENTCGYLICELVQIIDCNTHDLMLAKVVSSSCDNDNKPMTYQYYHEVIKGSAPKKAPTYIEEVSTEEDSYVCDVCGYVHQGPVPDDFVCPICGVDASHFKKRK